MFVKRFDRAFLLSIKKGDYEYAELLQMANLKQQEMEMAFENSDLQEKPDRELLNELTYKIRKKFYAQT